MPHWLRTDNDNQFDAPDKQQIRALREAAKQKQLDEEWRLFYVAVTRARHGVLFTSAHWYGDTQKPQGPSKFYDWITEQDDLVIPVVPDEPSSDEPPGTAERRRRQEHAAAQRAADQVAEAAAATAASTVAKRKGSARRGAPAQLGFSFAAGAPSFGTASAPRALPVSAFSLLARCARQFHWTHIRPMPQQASAASVVGTRVHGWIEAHGARLQLDQRQPSLFDSAELTVAPAAVSTAAGDLAPDAYSRSAVGESKVATATSAISGFGQSFLASRFGLTAPLHVELPITLDADGLLVRGRIDALYTGPSGASSNASAGVLHVVDFKTGRLPLDADPGAPVQLDLYGLAALQRLGSSFDSVSTSELYLDRNGGAPTELERAWSPDRAHAAQQFLVESVQRVRGGDQQPHTGEWCRRCPYQDLCAEGRAAVRASNITVVDTDLDEAFSDPLVVGTQDPSDGSMDTP